MFKPNYAADILYPTLRNRGRRSLVWSFLTRRSRYLHPLPQVEAVCSINARHDSGVQTVKISQIRGSAGRSQDFDRDFNLLRSHNKGRWLRVAEAQQRGTTLPLVDLIQIGDIYFVNDGHHRISVARAFAHFLRLANIAEQHHRVRRRREYQLERNQPFQRGSADHEFGRWIEAGTPMSRLEEALRSLRIELVLTCSSPRIRSYRFAVERAPLRSSSR